MSKTTVSRPAIEWHHEYVVIYDSSISKYRKIRTVNEAKALMKQTSCPFARLIAALCVFALTAVQSPHTAADDFLSKLEQEAKQLERHLSSSPFLEEWLSQLLPAIRKSHSVNGMKTDIYHESIRLSIKIEEYFKKQTAS